METITSQHRDSEDLQWNCYYEFYEAQIQQTFWLRLFTRNKEYKIFLNESTTRKNLLNVGNSTGKFLQLKPCKCLCASSLTAKKNKIITFLKDRKCRNLGLNSTHVTQGDTQLSKAETLNSKSISIFCKRSSNDHLKLRYNYYMCVCARVLLISTLLNQ